MNRKNFEREIFGRLFQTANNLQVYLDHILKEDGLTAKQMFLMIVINAFGDHRPSLREVADKSGSSYQNVKQLALKLQQVGYVAIEDDPKDGRKKRLSLTVKAFEYWETREERDQADMNRLFHGCTTEELGMFLDVMERLQGNICNMGGSNV